MTDPAIRVENIAKEYVIGGVPLSGRTFREALTDRFMHPFRRFARQQAAATEERFWALRDVSFDIQPGEVVGIIGRNGAGKSTLLKILSRITAPTHGRVEIRGRIASLLEVGTGFHPELTGRENIRLNGAILGMTQREIRAKFDEIVDFAGVERFIDTPVKRYSSGMQVRLAFAVAAHLDPEILLVDEVLAVGDAEFQKKCLGKMQEITGRGGRTVIFVSHNLAATRSLCTRSIMLANGEVVLDGDTGTVISRYMQDLPGAGGHHSLFTALTRSGGGPFLVSAAIPDNPGDSGGGKSEAKFKLILRSDSATNVNVDFRIRDIYGNPVVFASIGALERQSPVRMRDGLTSLELALDVSRLAVGRYIVSIDINTPFVEFFERHEDCLTFDIDHLCWNGLSTPLEQSWGYGSMYIPLRIVGLEAGHAWAVFVGSVAGA